MASSSLLERVRTLADRLRHLHPRSDADIATLGLMAGALFALDRAIALGYHDGRATPNPATMATEFEQTIAAVADGAAPTTAWLAGFHFHAATMRLAALNERLDRAADVARATRRSVNSLKHEADAHISGAWNVLIEQVVTEAEALGAIIISRLQ